MTEIESLGELYSVDFELTKTVVMNQFWHSNHSFSMKLPRHSNALVLFTGCSAVYHDKRSQKSIDIPCGSLFFIPQGAIYDWTFYNTKEGVVSDVLFEFSINDICLKEGARLIEGGYDNASIHFQNLLTRFSRPEMSPASVRSASYELLSWLLDHERRNVMKDSASCIYKGIKYLENDPVQDKSIAEIAQMCNVSVNYFEKLFKEYAGCTPCAYRIKKKMERAGMLLLSGDMTVQQVSLELGFEDNAYFCRAFKRYYGCTPTEYRS